VPPIATVEEGILRADEFVGRYDAFKRPLSAKKDGDTWLLEYDVGIMTVEKLKLRLDVNTGSVIEYNDPRASI
jgi:hypothetical protein